MNLSTPTGLVYLIQEGDTNLFKIGFSKTPLKRLAGLQTGNPHELRIVKTWPGTRFIETRFHSELEEIRGKGEWFKIEDVDSVLSAIEAATSCFAPFVPKAKAERKPRVLPHYIQNRLAIVDGWRQALDDYKPLSKEESRMKTAAIRQCISYKRIIATSNRPEPSRGHMLNVLTIKRLMFKLGIVTAEIVA